ncbi:MAG: tol-pal system protein YbgF [Propionivibrio sp.]|uniref:Cell division coordinator CpoB n=1 Tax=Candidatus Propionivibrio dominans TaxID=2954373 RepID=A0A9D7II56_9RHOO|nr:tol-pal system protein YbgF [Candidatus Propionivibrio dominans]
MPGHHLRFASGLESDFFSGRSKGLATSLLTLTLLLALFAAPRAQAGMFDDEEARRQIKDLSIKSNERLDTLSKAQFDLVNQIQALREENAKLRGQVETLNFELESAKKRQQDFYIDLDGRLRKLEPQSASAAESKPGDEAKPGAVPGKKVASDPAAEAREYEAALNLFKANKIKEAAGAFQAFVKEYPDSTLTPNAQYWLGNAHYSLRDCKKSIDAHKAVVNKWPQHPKAPDSMINIATCQQELGDAKGARSTLESVLSKYPDSPAAATAKQRLKK